MRSFGCLIYFIHSFLYIHCQLIVNIKTQKGEIFKENINANGTDDFVILEFTRTDGNYFAQLIDFKQELQIFRVIVLGEEELGQSPFEESCFVLRYQRGDFISSDAMSKLRQKNPGTIRVPEEDKGSDHYIMDLSVNVPSSSVLSAHISTFCAKALTSTYASDQDLKYWASQVQDLDGNWSFISDTTHHLPTKGVVQCNKLPRENNNSCLCFQQVCIPWYPCALKYCKGHDNSGKTISYRCGIRTCRKCYNFSYYVSHRHYCLGDI